MATQDARSTTLRDLDVDPNVAAREHTPSLHPRERFVRCTTCGVTAPYSVTAEGPIRRALAELASIGCGRYELPDVSVGDHVPTVTPEHPANGRSVVCEFCGRTAPLGDDRERVLEALAEIPCTTRLSHTELGSLVFSPNEFRRHSSSSASRIGTADSAAALRRRSSDSSDTIGSSTRSICVRSPMEPTPRRCSPHRTPPANRSTNSRSRAPMPTSP